MRSRRNIAAALLAAVATLWLIAGQARAETPDTWFDVETLNEGLGPVPATIDRSTPRATLRSLLDSARREDWAAAAHLLDLSPVAPGHQADVGPDLARQLQTVIARKVVLDWRTLIDRPDAMDASESSNAATAGMARRSLLVWELDLGQVPAEIRLNRLRPAGGEPVWVFSNRTVPLIEPLYREYGPSQLEGLIPRALKETALWGIMWWELIGLPILLAIAATVGWLVNRLIDMARRRARRRLFRNVIRATATPAVIAAVTLVLWWGIKTVFVFSGRLDVLMSPLVATGFVTALLMFVVNVVEAVLDRLLGFDEIDLSSRSQAENRVKATRIAAIRRLLVVVIFVVGAGIVLSTANVFQSLGLSVLASAGALTLIIGFAARKVLGNILASIQIAMNQSARVGDRIVFKDHLCHVERINLTYVQLRDWVGTRLIVPVEEFANETFENWTIKTPEMLRILKFKMAPGTDIEALREAFDEVLDSLDQDELDSREKASVKVTGQDVFGIDVWFALPCADPNTSWDLACEAREKIVARAAAIERDTGTRIFPEATPAEAV